MPPEKDPKKDEVKNDGDDKLDETSSGADDEGGKAEIGKLTQSLADKAAEVEGLTTQVTDLTTANKKFADDATKLSGVAEERTTLAGQLATMTEERDKGVTDLDEARAKIKSTEEDSITRRKAALVKDFSIPEDKVAGLTATQLDAVEATVSSVKAPPNNGHDGKGLDLHGDGGGAESVDTMTEADRAERTIEKLKAKK